jgi:hypothetical protein
MIARILKEIADKRMIEGQGFQNPLLTRWNSIKEDMALLNTEDIFDLQGVSRPPLIPQ